MLKIKSMWLGSPGNDREREMFGNTFPIGDFPIHIWIGYKRIVIIYNTIKISHILNLHISNLKIDNCGHIFYKVPENKNNFYISWASGGSCFSLFFNIFW